MDLISWLTAEHQDYVLMLSNPSPVIGGIGGNWINGRRDYFSSTLDGVFEPFTVDLAPDNPVPVMLAEQRVIRGLSAQFGYWYLVLRLGHDATYEKWAQPDINPRSKFSTHMQKENLLPFPMACRVLTAEEIRRMGNGGRAE